MQDKFEIDKSSDYFRMYAFVLETMQRLYRLYKCRLHNYYKSKRCGKTDEERKKNPPPDLPQPQWEYLIKYYGSDKFKVFFNQTMYYLWTIYAMFMYKKHRAGHKWEEL